MSIRLAESSLSLDLFQKLAYSRTEEIYEVTRKQLHDVGLVQITDYFESCWHPIRHEWALSLSTVSPSGYWNKQLAGVYQPEDQECLFCLFRSGGLFQRLPDSTCLSSNQKRSYSNQCASKISVKAIGSLVEVQYSRFLTSYAAKLVREQLEKFEKVQFIDGKVKDLNLHQSSPLVIFIRL